MDGVGAEGRLYGTEDMSIVTQDYVMCVCMCECGGEGLNEQGGSVWIGRWRLLCRGHALERRFWRERCVRDYE